jgi:chromate transporter
MILHQHELGSVTWAAVLLSTASVLAIFRFKIGVIPTLALCSGLGFLIHAWPWLHPLIG